VFADLPPLARGRALHQLRHPSPLAVTGETEQDAEGVWRVRWHCPCGVAYRVPAAEAAERRLAAADRAEDLFLGAADRG